jgi:hypothetical protein
MSKLLKTLTPVAVFAAAAAGAWSTLSGAGDTTLHAAARAPAAPAAASETQPLFISERFDEQKRNARSDDLPPQF